LLSVALERLSSSELWRTKPKLHLTQELCELTGDNPTLYWCYRDGLWRTPCLSGNIQSWAQQPWLQCKESSSQVSW
jgi:hypothetical protein